MTRWKSLIVCAGALAASPLLMASSCATAPAGGQAQEFAVDYCDELLPKAEEQMAQSYQEQGGETDRVAASVTGPFGETLEMEMEVTTGSSEPQEQTFQTGLSDLVLNCGSSPHDNRTCAVEVYLDSELIGRGNFQTTGQLAMRCIPAGQRELQILTMGGHQEIHREVVTIESDREYMAHVTGDHHSDVRFEFYGESDLSHGFAMPVDDGSGDSMGVRIEHEHYEGDYGHGAEADAVYTDDPGPTGGEPGPSTADDAPPVDAQPMTSWDFDDLVSRIDDATFGSDKRDLIEDAMSHNYFTADQAASLVARIDSMHDQEDLAIKFYPLVVDRNQFHVVIDAVDSSIGRDNVREELGL